MSDEFLDHLVGRWTLTGQMGSTPLRQDVVARWVLNNLFVEIHFKSTLPGPGGGPPYEAIYHLGHNLEQAVYILHLLDTFGVATTCSVGTGRRVGNTIPFVFDYASGPFTNRFVWDSERDEWTFEQTSLAAGQERLFATKRMVRRA